MKKRILVLLATMVTAVLVVSGVALAAPPGEPIEDEFSNATFITINDGVPVGTATPYPSSINVSGFPEGSLITDVNVSLLGFDHFIPDDVDVLLVGPHGQSTILMSDAGGTSDVAELNIHLDNQAKSGLPNECCVPNSTDIFVKPANYRPSDTFPDPDQPGEVLTTGKRASLSVFNRTDPNGEWRLFVVDDIGFNEGFISGGWTLTITARS
jgi:subtilisin-like proprotein convertase family protein